MAKQQDIIEVVDEFADAINPDRVLDEAERLGLTVEELMERVKVEVMTRVED